MKRFLFTVAIIALALVSTSLAALAQTDPAAVVKQFQAAVDRNDVDGQLALLTDDAVRKDPINCQTPCVGKVAIRKALEIRAVNVRVATVGGLQVSGNTVTGHTENRSAAITAAGIERIVNVNTYEVRGDKISAHTIQRDSSDPLTAAVLKAQKAASATPGTLPTTGADPTANYSWVMALGGLSILGLGWALRRRRALAAR